MKQPQKFNRFIKFWFRPYGASITCADLAQAVDGRRLKLEDSKWRKKNGHILINWGNSHPSEFPVDLNVPEAVAVATSKMQTWRVLQAAGIPVPQWTQDKGVAQEWLNDEKVLGRDLDRGSQGRGINVYKRGSVLNNHLFYSKYFRKNRELRVHVFNGEVIFIQEKLKVKGEHAINNYIRNYDNGWIFAFKHLAEHPCPEVVKTVAVAAVESLGLNFGGVDCGWHRDSGCVAFEVNTAPGLEESSLKAYANAIKQLGE